jgi:hypothetical protein
MILYACSAMQICEQWTLLQTKQGKVSKQVENTLNDMNMSQCCKIDRCSADLAGRAPSLDQQRYKQVADLAGCRAPYKTLHSLLGVTNFPSVNGGDYLCFNFSSRAFASISPVEPLLQLGNFSSGEFDAKVVIPNKCYLGCGKMIPNLNKASQHQSQHQKIELYNTKVGF